MMCAQVMQADMAANNLQPTMLASHLLLFARMLVMRPAALFEFFSGALASSPIAVIDLLMDNVSVCCVVLCVCVGVRLYICGHGYMPAGTVVTNK